MFVINCSFSCQFVLFLCLVSPLSVVRGMWKSQWRRQDNIIWWYYVLLIWPLNKQWIVYIMVKRHNSVFFKYKVINLFLTDVDYIIIMWFVEIAFKFHKIITSLWRERKTGLKSTFSADRYKVSCYLETNQGRSQVLPYPCFYSRCLKVILLSSHQPENRDYLSCKKRPLMERLGLICVTHSSLQLSTTLSKWFKLTLNSPSDSGTKQDICYKWWVDHM